MHRSAHSPPDDGFRCQSHPWLQSVWGGKDVELDGALDLVERVTRLRDFFFKRGTRIFVFVWPHSKTGNWIL